MRLSLTQFEKIDGLMAQLLRMGPFETCEDARGYIRTSNILLDACIDATSLDFLEGFPSALECAAYLVTGALLGTVEIVDELENA